jgi:hypothetical protein
MPTSPQQMMEAIERNLPERTGRTLRQWVAIVKKQGPEERKDRVAWLRREHALGGATAMLIAYATEGRSPRDDYADQEGLVSALYAGRRAALRPVHEAALAAARSLGKDVTASARKTYVTLARSKQFAVIQPSTNDRVDLGLVLPGVAGEGRLEASGSVGGGRVTHRVRLSSPKDVDARVRRWLRAAYEQA